MIEWNAIVLIVTTAAVTWRMCYVGMEWLFELQHVTASREQFSLMKQARVEDGSDLAPSHTASSHARTYTHTTN